MCEEFTFKILETRTKTQMTQSFNQYSENETKIWRKNILNQFNRVFSFSFRNLSNKINRSKKMQESPTGNQALEVFAKA